MSKQALILVFATVVFVLGVLVVKSLSTGSNVLGTSQGNGQGQAGNGMNMNSQPVSSTVFDSLVGKKAPNFTLTTYNGESYSLSGLKGKNVVLFFSEGLMCYPACWNQIAAFGTDSRFNNKDTIALSIIEDNKNDWANAIAKMPDLAKATVLFDNGSTAQTYGVLSLPSSMHTGQLPGHSYVVIDKNGVVRYVFDDPNMAIGNDNLAAQVSKF